MKVISGADVERALEPEGSKRVYLCGRLQWPGPLEHIENDGYEIGISYYKHDTVEKPHYHKTNHEYNYVICGEMKVYIFQEEREYRLRAGDLFLIEPGMPYVGKARAGTRVIFSKVPGGNDKVLYEGAEAVLGDWTSGWDGMTPRQLEEQKKHGSGGRGQR